MLLDFNEHLGLQSRINFAEVFATRFGLPKKYEIFMRGLWHLDRQQFSVSLSTQCSIAYTQLTGVAHSMRFKISHTHPSPPSSRTT